MSKARRTHEVSITIARLDHGRGLPLPKYQTDEAAGLDLMAAIGKTQPVVLQPGARARIPTGLRFELPPEFEGQVRPRSGLAFKHGVTVLNTPGTIDSDYRGEVQVILINLGDAPYAIERGDRIAQLVIAPVTHVVIKATTRLAKSKRGTGGFGSTGGAKAASKVKSKARSATTAKSSSTGKQTKAAKTSARKSRSKRKSTEN